MAARQTSTVTDDNLLMVYFQRRLIKVLDEQVWFYQLCEKYPLPEGSGTQMTFNGWRRLAAASVTLAEQSANDAVALSSRSVNVTILGYGRGVKISDLLEKTSIAPPVQGAIERLMQAAALTLDNVVQLAVFKNVLSQVGKDGSRSTILSSLMSTVASALCANTGTNANRQFGFPAVYATSAARLSAVSATAPSISARFGPIGIRKAVDRLRSFDAQPYADGNYAAVVHPKAMSTGMGNADLKQWFLNWDGGPQQSMWKGTVTSPLHGVRFILSTNTPRYAVAAHSVNITAILSEGAVGVTELGGGVEMIIKRPGPSSTDNPYNLFSTASFKLRAVAAVLNPSAGAILFSHERV